MKQSEFIKSLGELNIIINDIQLKQLHQYYNLLVEWNKIMNLTAIIDIDDVYLKHFYDSLTITKVIDLNEIKTLCDIGTGAGFPGLVLKIVYPDLKIVLVDSLNKRVNFLKEVIKQLNLKNIEVVNARAEEYAINNREQFDVVTARAVAPLNILLEYCLPLVKINGFFIPMKGNINEELDNSSKALDILKAKLISKSTFLLPFEESNRTILKIKKTEKTNVIYPRKYSDMKKKPL
ncbi:MAG: 16S rRNA (guanine(527)-N(7))-methyltransferase RsmG [Bacilli bacterium]